ncbi:MAG: TetR/AcrR family transcriptional regulator [Verrucomicrobiota bacterium]
MPRDTRSALLDAGSDLFLEKGYSSVGLKEILERAGAPKGSFYHHFESKEDFARAIVLRGAECFRDTLTRRLSDPERTPMERLQFHFEAQIDYMKSLDFKQSCFFLKLGTEMAATSPLIKKTLEEVLEGWLSIIAECIREGQQDGSIRTEDSAEELAGVLHNLWEGASLSAQIQHDAKPLVAAAGHMRKTLSAE